MTAALLLATAIAWPVVLTAAFMVRRLRAAVVVLAPTLALPALALGFAGEPALELQVPGLFTSMRLGVDGIGRAFLLLTALLWTCAVWHTASYMRADPRRRAFTGFLLATGTGNIGLTLVQDTLSFYLFFALMTFAAYGLVVHTRTADALRAGRVYIVMAVLGEALILAGLFGITALATDATFAAVPDAFAVMTRPGLVATVLLLGFGVKAGLVPLHLWLPLAHPVAPTPASALLSGAMIKAGVLGWLRFVPAGEMSFSAAGITAMTLGITATLAAAVAGTLQRDVKTVLAYSSISQMGFVATGFGAALLVPTAAPLMVLAVAVYAVHHALAKAALFLAIPVAEGSRRPLMLVTAALPGLVLAGAPFTSGAMAKAALKSALGGETWPVPVDLLLSVAAVGTTLLIARYVSLLALAPARIPATGSNRGGQSSRELTVGLVAPWALLVALSVVGALWLPWVLAPLGELPLATQPAYVAGALWPVALGVVLAGGALLLRRRYPAWTVPSVPAGDVLAVVERAARTLHSVGAPLARIAPGHAAARGWYWLEARTGAGLDRAAAAYDRAAAGPALGAIMVILAVLLFLALR
ncbi:MAG TPA: complex I subunit 5 family protein [Longimicrobiales bacterium]|nr:complex I subunit 5 family protein [Longimicrobiales bacterium]